MAINILYEPQKKAIKAGEKPGFNLWNRTKPPIKSKGYDSILGARKYFMCADPMS